MVCASELAGEIGAIDRFASERSLALYLGMANLDNSSGKFRGSKAPKHVNTRAKGAMMAVVDKHRKCLPESQYYYEKNGLRENHIITQFVRLAGSFTALYSECQNHVYEIRTKKNENT